MSLRLVSVVTLIFSATACSSSSTGDRGGSGGVATGGSAGAGGGSAGAAGAPGGAAGTPGTGGGGPIPKSCWSGPATCNPVDGKGCPGGQQCDLINNAAAIGCRNASPQSPGGGQACETDTNFCKPGFICDAGPVLQCAKPCCEKSDCAATDKCVPLPGGGGSFGFCKP